MLGTLIPCGTLLTVETQKKVYHTGIIPNRTVPLSGNRVLVETRPWSNSFSVWSINQLMAWRTNTTLSAARWLNISVSVIKTKILKPSLQRQSQALFQTTNTLIQRHTTFQTTFETTSSPPCSPQAALYWRTSTSMTQLPVLFAFDSKIPKTSNLSLKITQSGK